MRQLLEAADRMAEAATGHMTANAARREKNEEMVESLSEKDIRGSRDWWAAFCRQYTGSHFLDSGSAYGYKYEQPVSECVLHIETYRGIPEYFSINTVDFLNELLDASDEVAVALEELLYWIGDNVDADGTWIRTMEQFKVWLYELVGFAPYDWEDEQQMMHAQQDIEAYLDGPEAMHFHGPSRYDKTRGLPEDWASTFPWEALETVAKAGTVKEGYLGGDNTYNGESDLDQVLQFETIIVGQVPYIMLQAHTGCDVRGGYTKPIVALMQDYEYFFSFTVDLWCTECGQQYDLAYSYAEDLKKLNPSKPIILANSVPLDPEEGYVTVPAEMAELLCPKCESYNLHPSTMAYGF